MSDAARRILLTILVLGIAGISLELWLMAHTEDVYQQIPLWLAAAGIATAIMVAARPSIASVRLHQAVMVLFLVSGIVGMVLHFQVNIEFQMEMDAALSGLALYQKAILAKSPPALAPGAMIQLGLIGLAYTFRHPVLALRSGA
jgi:FtsH-binding integral membrane protein